MKELLPCPFCGSTNVILRSQYEITGYGSTNQYAVCCDATQGGCGVTGGYSINENIAMNKWNKRSKEVCDMNNNTINIVEIDGKQYKVVLEEIAKEPKQEKRKTGYERVEKGGVYWANNLDGKTYTNDDDITSFDDEMYDTANYYTDEQLAKDNARADELMRRLRRFSAEHREKKIDWGNRHLAKYLINYDHNSSAFSVFTAYYFHKLSVYFDTEESAQLAIDTFHEDLIWYFTEYEDTAEFRGM